MTLEVRLAFSLLYIAIFMYEYNGVFQLRSSSSCSSSSSRRRWLIVCGYGGVIIAFRTAVPFWGQPPIFQVVCPLDETAVLKEFKHIPYLVRFDVPGTLFDQRITGGSPFSIIEYFYSPDFKSTADSATPRSGISNSAGARRYERVADCDEMYTRTRRDGKNVTRK